MWRIFPFLFLCIFAVTTGQVHEYCVVGAGPGGLQMAHFLQQASRDYVLFEKGDRVGSFYRKYPIHRKLISINKRYTGSTNKEFNLRHDWNSLISNRDDLKMTKYSKEMFPDASVYVNYLNDFAGKLKLNVRLNTTIGNMRKTEDGKFFELTDQLARKFSCKFLIVATGISKPNDVRFHGKQNTISYEDLSLDLEMFRDQAVLILGRGNSAFEVAQHIMPATSYVHMMARSPVRLAWATHYVGDLRAVNDGLLDTYQLKSLDALFEDDVTRMRLERSKKDGRIYVDGQEETDDDGADNHATRDGYDYVIRCLGFQFDQSPFDPQMMPSSGERYPLIKDDYESAQIAGLYFSGTNTHSLDYRKSAGGFIHGFRYSTRTLHRILEWRNHGVKWPTLRFRTATDLVSHATKRINEASDLWQMFSVLCDVIVHDGSETSRYLEAYPCSRLPLLATTSGHDDVGGDRAITAVNFEYGGNFTGDGADPFGEERAVNRWQMAHHSNFLHPVFYHYSRGAATAASRWQLPADRVHHLLEDFLTKFQTPVTHLQQLRHFVEDVTTGRDQRLFFAAQCFRLAMTTQGGVPESCWRHRPVIRSARLPEIHPKFLPLRDLKFATNR